MNTSSIKLEGQIAGKQSQHLLLSMAMQQAFHVLQMPILELSEWLHLSIEQNPVLELDESNSPLNESLDDLIDHPDENPPSSYDPAVEEALKKRKAYEESLLSYPLSLYEHLLQQARFTFTDPQDLLSAELLIGHLDQRGFLTTPLEEIASSQELPRILQIIQTFDPSGIGARDLKDSLLLQLRQRNKQHTLAYTIIENHLEDLLHNRLPLLHRQLGVSLEILHHTIETDIAPLDTHPGYRFYTEYTCPIVPDIHLENKEDHWSITINHSFLPQFHVVPAYAKCFQEKQLPKEELHFLRNHIASGQWLKRIVKRRKSTLKCIAEFLIAKQSSFLSGDQKTLVPLTLQEMADELGMHESTMARAVCNKYLSCPQGLFPLRSFFTHGVKCQNGQRVSNHSLRQLLAHMVEKEDKKKPLSDSALAKQFKKMGLPCARRTVTKYRQHLKISPAARRKQWS